jgi:RalA-binding protein 1
MECAKVLNRILLQVQVLLDPPDINRLTPVCIVLLYYIFPFSLLISQLLALIANTESHTLTPDWLPSLRVHPTVAVSHPLPPVPDASTTPAVSGLPPTQQPSIRPLNISKVDDRHDAEVGISTSPASQSTSSSTDSPDGAFPPGSSDPSPIETAPVFGQFSRPSLAQLQAASRESRITLPEEAKQYLSSVIDLPADSEQHSRTLSPARSNTYIVSNPRDSTDKSSTRRDLSDGEFLDLEDSDSLYDSAADYSLTSAGPQDIRKPPDDLRQPRVSVQPPAADDFPLPPGVATPPNNPSNSEPTSKTPQAPPSVDRARRMDGPESPTTPTPNAYGSRSSAISTYQSVITEQESLVQFRALPLLPYDLPYTRINVTNSSIRPNDRGKDVLSFVVLVDPGNQKEPYMIEKLYSDVLGLDQRIRSRYGKNIHKKIPHLPDGKLWKDHAPSRVDQRKVWPPFCTTRMKKLMPVS